MVFRSLLIDRDWDYAVTSIGGATSGNQLRQRIVRAIDGDYQRLGDAMFTGTAHPRPAILNRGGRSRSMRVAAARKRRALGTAVPHRNPDVRRDRRGGGAPRVITGSGAMDLYRQNNTRSVAIVDTTTPASWSVRWTIWLQDLLLTHALLY